MTRPTVLLNTALICILSVNTASGQNRSAAVGITPREIDAHLRFLASDLLEGRAPAMRGGRLAEE
jgi:hypothetical protein